MFNITTLFLGGIVFGLFILVLVFVLLRLLNWGVLKLLKLKDKDGSKTKRFNTLCDELNCVVYLFYFRTILIKLYYYEMRLYSELLFYPHRSGLIMLCHLIEFLCFKFLKVCCVKNSYAKKKKTKDSDDNSKKPKQ